ncbi:MAG: AAA family ATPase [Azoarcus sp.]|jgi:nitrogenase iron protein NifH|nr:AAA family ATPase [Azoarcus sp.]
MSEIPNNRVSFHGRSGVVKPAASAKGRNIGKHIAIYGKGGIGKSTTTSNISAALAEAGYKVIQIGCDPKSDSTNTLRGNHYLPTILDSVRGGNKVHLADISATGFKGILCIESGGPVPGVGCAGRGINAAVTLLQELKLFEEFKPDYVLYDVLGDVVCGGFAVPIRDGITDRAYVVTSSDFMAIYAANNLFKAVSKYAPTGGAKLGGIIGNGLSAAYSNAIIDDFAGRTGVTVAGYVPRALVVSQSELYGKTVIEANPASEHANIYRKLAKYIAENEDLVIPHPLGVSDLRDWARDWGDRVFSLETGTGIAADRVAA